MNRINQLLDEQYVVAYLKKRILPKYPDFSDIKKVVIKPWKKHIWEKTYHVVIEFNTTFIDVNGEEKKLPIFCTAHSNEPRKNVYDSLRFLQQNGFTDNSFQIPLPLYYSSYFLGTFYQGLEGENLYYYIKKNDFAIVEKIIVQTAKWFVYLHSLRVPEKDLNKENSRIRTVFPGVEHIFERIETDFPEYLSFYQQAYAFFIRNEEEFLNSTLERWLVHGDAHPENIIRVDDSSVGVIDFADLSFSDFARDLGTFSQQLEYMGQRKIVDRDYCYRMKELFLEKYFQYSQIELTPELQKRIDNYYNWTVIRTATYHLLRHNGNPERARNLIEQVKKKLNLEM